MVLALMLAIFVFVVGPTVLILNLLPTALGDYAGQPRGDVGPVRRGGRRHGEVAVVVDDLLLGVVDLVDTVRRHVPRRISRGRTIRQFVVGVIWCRRTVSLVWFAFRWVPGSASSVTGSTCRQWHPESTLFGMLDHLPFVGLSSLLVMALVAIFFVSGADAASMVMGTLSQRGSLDPRDGWSRSGLATGAVAS